MFNNCLRDHKKFPVLSTAANSYCFWDYEIPSCTFQIVPSDDLLDDNYFQLD
jgi:hypothetical protein